MTCLESERDRTKNGKETKEVRGGFLEAIGIELKRLRLLYGQREKYKEDTTRGTKERKTHRKRGGDVIKYSRVGLFSRTIIVEKLGTK